MTTPDSRRPRATIVMTFRERHALAEGAIESIVAHTARPYRFVYVDIQSPGWLRERLAQRADEWGLEVVRFDEPLWPQEARRRVVGALDTDYVVFIDNDTRVEDGWLEALVACADETGAGIVGPLYLIGGGTQPATIHMAGGRLTESATPAGRAFVGDHWLEDADPAAVADKLVRRQCDFVEYHCMLIRGELLRDGTLLDPRIHCVHEHLDTALAVRERGYPTWFEPAARVTYLGHHEYMLDDVPLFRNRWTREATIASVDAFCAKWGVAADERTLGGALQFIAAHRAAVDPIRPPAPASTDRRQPMRREELRQTRSDLLDLAVARGYSPQDVAWLAGCYHIAQILTDGGYRPCGRPFINHLAGTASVLLRYDFRPEVVGAGLLHAAYTHSPSHRDGPRATVEYVCAALGGEESALERRVRAYTRRGFAGGALAAQRTSSATFSVADAEILALTAANEIDMHLSGEIRYSGRTDAVPPHAVELIASACRTLGVDGLAETLVEALRAPAAAVTADLRTGIPFSYRVSPDKQSAVRMTSDAAAALG